MSEINTHTEREREREREREHERNCKIRYNKIVKDIHYHTLIFPAIYIKYYYIIIINLHVVCSVDLFYFLNCSLQ